MTYEFFFGLHYKYFRCLAFVTSECCSVSKRVFSMFYETLFRVQASYVMSRFAMFNKLSV